MASQSPERWMRRAIALSQRGFPAPNPHVGCVIVKNGRAVGEGWHAYAGGLHAEAMALAEAGALAKGAEVFVTLEPCNHQGKQPPCTHALVEAGVKKVWVAIPDPNPNVKGRGMKCLLRSGIDVESGLNKDEAEAVNQTWLKAMRFERPFVSLKAAITMDGRIALPTGESQWITGEEARKQARRLRAELGAVLVGSGTVASDDPLLTSRTKGVKNEPERFVLDLERKLSEKHNVFQGESPATRVVHPERAIGSDLEARIKDGKLDLEALLRSLWERGITGLLVEGGTQTISSFLAAGLADRIELFMGNVAFGIGPSWLEGSLGANLESLARWRFVHAKKLDNDVWLRFEPQEDGIPSLKP